MNRLKSYFVMTYMLMAGAIILVALYQLAFSGLGLTWLGALLAALPPIALYLWVGYIRRTPRTSARLPILTGISLLGFGLAVYGSLTEEGNVLIGLVAAGVASLGFLLYTNWYSIFYVQLNPKLAKNKPLPVFEVEDTNGRTISSDVLLGKPALLLFYRGNWCPICMAQVNEITSRYRELIDRGVQVALISPQPHDLTRRVADLYGVPFYFWVDVDNRAARAIDMVNDDGVPAGFRKTYGVDTVLPTAVITDAAGKIIFADQARNYRVRPDPDVFIEALAAHGL